MKNLIKYGSIFFMGYFLIPSSLVNIYASHNIQKSSNKKVQTKAKNHLYMGLSYGWQELNGQNSGSVNNSVDLLSLLGPGAPSLSFSQNSPKKILNNGGSAGVFLGYRMFFSRLFSIDLEGAFNSFNRKFLATNKLEESANPVLLRYSVKIKQKNDYNLLLKPNIHLYESTGIFIAAGVSKSKISYSVNSDYLQGLLISPPHKLMFSSTNEIGKSGKYKNGIILGLGMEQYLTNNFNLRFEYNHTRYKSNNYKYANNVINISTTPGFPFSVPSIVPNGLSELSHKYKIRNNAIKLGLSYNFMT